MNSNWVKILVRSCFLPSTEVVLLSSFHLNMPWKDVMQTQGSHWRKYFLKTVFNRMKSTLSHMCESRVWKNFETPFYSFKVDSFFSIFSGFRFLFFLVFFNVAWLSQVCFDVYLPMWAYIKLLTMFSPFILCISNSFLRTN